MGEGKKKESSEQKESRGETEEERGLYKWSNNVAVPQTSRAQDRRLKLGVRNSPPGLCVLGAERQQRTKNMGEGWKHRPVFKMCL